MHHEESNRAVVIYMQDYSQTYWIRDAVEFHGKVTEELDRFKYIGTNPNAHVPNQFFARHADDCRLFYVDLHANHLIDIEQMDLTNLSDALIKDLNPAVLILPYPMYNELQSVVQKVVTANVPTQHSTGIASNSLDQLTTCVANGFTTNAHVLPAYFNKIHVLETILETQEGHLADDHVKLTIQKQIERIYLAADVVGNQRDNAHTLST